jgi:hypothetical protein
VLFRCDLKVAEMIVCRKDQFIRRAVPSALPYEAWRDPPDDTSAFDPLVIAVSCRLEAQHPNRTLQTFFYLQTSPMLPNHLVPPIRLPGPASADIIPFWDGTVRFFGGNGYGKFGQTKTPDLPSRG